MNINFEYYKIFYYVGKYMSITAAAEKLSITQPAVSQSLKNLEQQMNVKLFVRSKKGVRLTPEGQKLFDYVAQGYEHFKQGEKKLQEMADVELGEIRIGASDMTLQYFLLPYLETFSEKFPKIKVSITNASTPMTLKHLNDGEIDFGVVSSPIENPSNYNIYKVRKIQDIFIVGKKYQELSNRILKMEELKDYHYICLEPHSSTRRYVDSFLKEKGVKLSPEFQLSTSAIIVQFAVRNFGIASVVEDFALDEIAKGNAFKLQLEESIPARDICIVTPKNISISRAASTLLDSIDKI